MTKSRHRAIDSAYMLDLRNRIGDLVTLSNSSEAEFLAQDVFDSVEALGNELGDNPNATTNLVQLMTSIQDLLSAFIISATDAAVASEDEFDERIEKSDKKRRSKGGVQSGQARRWHYGPVCRVALRLCAGIDDTETISRRALAAQIEATKSIVDPKKPTEPLEWRRIYDALTTMIDEKTLDDRILKKLTR